MKEEKTVEEQIRDSELINKVKNDLGEEAAEAAQIFTTMDKDEKDLTLFGVGLKSVCGAEISDILIATTLMKLMMMKDKDLTKTFLRTLLAIFSKKIREEVEKDGLLDKDNFFKTDDFRS